MTIEKHLVTLGDSWPEGAELGSGRRYGEIIAESQGRTLFNYGSGGASNEDTLYQLQKYIKDHWHPGTDTVAIFFLTNPARTAHFPRFMDTTKVTDPIFKEALLWFHKAEHEVMRSSSTVSAAQQWCQTLGIQDYYFAGWVRYNHWLPGVNTDKIYAQGQQTAADWFGAAKHNGEHLLDVGDNEYIKPNFCHPNQLGHNLIADKLTSWINSTQSL